MMSLSGFQNSHESLDWLLIGRQAFDPSTKLGAFNQVPGLMHTVMLVCNVNQNTKALTMSLLDLLRMVNLSIKRFLKALRK